MICQRLVWAASNSAARAYLFVFLLCHSVESEIQRWEGIDGVFSVTSQIWTPRITPLVVQASKNMWPPHKMAIQFVFQ